MALTTKTKVGVLFGGTTVLIVGLALRAPIIAVSPILTKIQAAYGLGSISASLLTSLPVLCFGALAFVSPWLGRRFGLERSVTALLVLITVGVLLRAVWGTAGLFIGTVVIGSGIAIGNVLMPALIKRHWSAAAGPLMSTLSISLTVGPTLAALLTVPMFQTFHENVRVTLVAWVLFPVLGLIVFQGLRRRLPAATQVRPGSAVGQELPVNVWRAPLAWQISLFLGLQSFLFYSLAAWLPTVLVDGGLSDVDAGIAFAVFPAFNIISSWLYPLWAVRLPRQSGPAALAAGLWAIGIAGLLLAPASTAYAWTAVAGLGSGGTFSLALTLLVLRTRNEATTAKLSGMAQAVGYSLAATGPLVVGWLFQSSNGWTTPLILLLAITPLVAITGVASGRPRHVGAERSQEVA